MDSRKYFEVVHFLQSGLLPRKSTKTTRHSLRRRSRKYFTKDGRLYLIVSNLEVLHRGNARIKLLELHRESGHPAGRNLEKIAKNIYSALDIRELCTAISRECSICNDKVLYKYRKGPMNLVSENVLDRICRETGLIKYRRHCYELFVR